jgi:tellurite resistance protein TerC
MSPHTLLWLIFAVALLVMLYVDLFQSKSDKAITLREAGLRSLEWVAAALLYCGAIYWLLSPAKAAEFLTGYLIEKSLSVDNLFVLS